MTSRFDIRISDDKLIAEIRIRAQTPVESLTVEAIVQFLHRHKIRYGINKQAIETILNYHQFDEFLPVAYGYPVEQGVNPSIKLKFNPNHVPRPVIQENGKMDYRNMNYIQNVRLNDVLADILPPQAGTLGRTVHGDIILPRRSQDCLIQPGNNTRVAGDTIVATANGSPILKDNQIHVLTDLEIHSDINYGTGNIEFAGNLVVHGHVRQNFDLTIGGSLVIDGHVEQSQIKVDGDLTVGEGIALQKKGNVHCYGKLKAGFIENSKIFCLNDLEVAKAIMHSEIECMGTVRVGTDGHAGWLSGGRIRATQRIEVGNCGAKTFTNTHLELSGHCSVEPELTLDSAKVAFLNKEIIRLTDALHDIVGHLTVLIRKKHENPDLGPTITQKMDELMAQRDTYKQKLVELNEKKRGLQVTFKPKPVEDEPIIIVHGIIYPGTMITIRGVRYYIDDEISHMQFREANGEIIPESLS